MSLQTWNCESEKHQSAKVKIFKVKISKLKPQTTKVKVFKVKSRKFSKLRAESFQLLSFDKLQVLKTRIRTACSKLSYQNWMLKVVESSKLNLESCRMLKLLECWKLSNTVKVLNTESLLICCLLTSFQRRSYCTQSGIKRIKRSEELWKVIYSKEILRVRVFYSSW